MNQLVIDGVSVRQDFNGRFCLNDLHRAAGGENKHKPSYFLSNEQTKALINELLFDGGIPASEENQPVTSFRGGVDQGTYACKELIYAYAMWISPIYPLVTQQAAFKRLAELGLVERKSRPSTKGVNKTKQFWSITAKGLIYGKNITSPNNPRETQPHFYESKSADLVKLMVVGQAA